MRKKNVSALSACSRLVALARTCENHDAAPQEKMLQHLSLAHHWAPFSRDEIEVEVSVSQ